MVTETAPREGFVQHICASRHVSKDKNKWVLKNDDSVKVLKRDERRLKTDKTSISFACMALIGYDIWLPP